MKGLDSIVGYVKKAVPSVVVPAVIAAGIAASILTACGINEPVKEPVDVGTAYGAVIPAGEGYFAPAYGFTVTAGEAESKLEAIVAAMGGKALAVRATSDGKLLPPAKDAAANSVGKYFANAVARVKANPDYKLNIMFQAMNPEQGLASTMTIGTYRIVNKETGEIDNIASQRFAFASPEPVTNAAKAFGIEKMTVGYRE